MLWRQRAGGVRALVRNDAAQAHEDGNRAGVPGCDPLPEQSPPEGCAGEGLQALRGGNVGGWEDAGGPREDVVADHGADQDPVGQGAEGVAREGPLVGRDSDEGRGGHEH